MKCMSGLQALCQDKHRKKNGIWNICWDTYVCDSDCLVGVTKLISFVIVFQSPCKKVRRSNSVLNALISRSHSTQMVSGATTGLCTWNGALTMCEWCLKNRDIFRDCDTVIELGSGVGLLGLFLGKLRVARRLLLTDHSQLVLKQLDQNISLNSEEDEDGYKFDNLCVHKLDWLDEPVLIPWEVLDPENAPEIGGRKQKLIILASDCVFDPELCKSLALVNQCRICHSLTLLNIGFEGATHKSEGYYILSMQRAAFSILFMARSTLGTRSVYLLDRTKFRNYGWILAKRGGGRYHYQQNR